MRVKQVSASSGGFASKHCIRRKRSPAGRPAGLKWQNRGIKQVLVVMAGAGWGGNAAPANRISLELRVHADEEDAALDIIGRRDGVIRGQLRGKNRSWSIRWRIVASQIHQNSQALDAISSSLAPILK